MSFLRIVRVVIPSFIYYGSQFGFGLLQINILDNFFSFEIPALVFRFDVKVYLQVAASNFRMFCELNCKDVFLIL
jgi:hypothetical protein